MAECMIHRGQRAADSNGRTSRKQKIRNPACRCLRKGKQRANHTRSQLQATPLWLQPGGRPLANAHQRDAPLPPRRHNARQAHSEQQPHMSTRRKGTTIATTKKHHAGTLKRAHHVRAMHARCANKSCDRRSPRQPREQLATTPQRAARDHQTRTRPRIGDQHAVLQMTL